MILLFEPHLANVLNVNQGPDKQLVLRMILGYILFRLCKNLCGDLSLEMPCPGSSK